MWVVLTDEMLDRDGMLPRGREFTDASLGCEENDNLLGSSRAMCASVWDFISRAGGELGPLGLIGRLGLLGSTALEAVSDPAAVAAGRSAAVVSGWIAVCVYQRRMDECETRLCRGKARRFGTHLEAVSRQRLLVSKASDSVRVVSVQCEHRLAGVPQVVLQNRAFHRAKRDRGAVRMEVHRRN